ncbi:esterase OVCA2 isoform X2 [Cryptotermes secundus]|uniref:esterase OVCA2 isoform X2 n=1 Tax=Cryptotermes secundus TaxID=105785 RepID=UPI000CD7B1F3|nr:esterase OVCA2 isoform X2 [Cryptotermes secundus]
MTSQENKLLRILCLHGYGQNGEVFRRKLGGVRKLLKKNAELIFVTAPNKIPPPEEHSVTDENAQINDEYAWWFTTENRMFDAKKPSDICLGFENSLALIEKTFEELGPFDGLLGFSQGAGFVGILCGMQQSNWLKYEFSFAILVGGFKSQCHPHLNYYLKASSIPSLHVYGENDKVISREMSELLLEQFSHVEISVHPGGHYVPATGPQKQSYISFLEDRKREIEIENRKKAKQIQVGSYTLERVEDSGSEPSEDDRHANSQGGDHSDSVCKEKGVMKADKEGISKQTSRKMMDSNTHEDIEVSSSRI